MISVGDSLISKLHYFRRFRLSSEPYFLYSTKCLTDDEAMSKIFLLWIYFPTFELSPCFLNILQLCQHPNDPLPNSCGLLLRCFYSKIPVELRKSFTIRTPSKRTNSIYFSNHLFFSCWNFAQLKINNMQCPMRILFNFIFFSFC